MEEESTDLMDLRPVTFRYKKTFANGEKPLQYGLIAEEVAEVYPELVVRDKTGHAETVQYHQLPVLLLNELQQQQRRIQRQDEQIRTQKNHLEVERAARMDLLRRLTALERVLATKRFLVEPRE